MYPRLPGDRRVTVGGRVISDRRKCRGITLIELMIVMAIVGFLILVSGVNLYDSASRNDVLNCAKRISADIKEARRWAQGGGSRVIFLTSLVPGSDTGPRDLDGILDIDGSNFFFHDEFYIIFPDTAFFAGWQTAYRPNILRHGVNGNALCDDDIVYLAESTLSSSHPTQTPSSQPQLIFSSLGTLLNFGSVNKYLYLEKNGHVARIEITALTGFTRIFINKESYHDCDGAACNAGTWTNNVNSQWQPIQSTL